MKLLTNKLELVQLAYDEAEAFLRITCVGKVAEYDETECDKLLRLYEYAADPTGDLAEFFEDEFGRFASRVAVSFVEHTVALGHHVYL